MNGPIAAASTGLLEGKVGIITGAGTAYGIGRECVKKFAAAGAKAIYACDLNTSGIASLREECKKAGYSTIIEGRLLDVSNEERTVAVVREITKTHGRFDFFIANAGFANYRSLNDTETIHYDRQVNVMTRGVFLAIKYGSQAMMVTSDQKPQPGGTFVVTGSCAGFLGSYSDLPYAVAKTALHGMISCGSAQLSASNIRINGVAPGFTKSGILTNSEKAESGEYKNEQSEEQLKQNHMWFFERAGLLKAPEYYYNRLQDPAEIASVQLFLATDLSSAVNGQMILADSGKTAAATGEACTGPIPPIKPLDLS
ncbi:hypothetical protein CLAIMM_00809 [Cladophialophora immunda]|nr:hypothetical protein CLAIMM_00809 [Cladophialophora immunda]